MKFILTKELGRLSRWLRLLGFDAAYFNSDKVKELFAKAFNEKRIVITKRRNISCTKNFKVIYIRGNTLKEQFAELRKSVKIGRGILFARCADCNEEIYAIKKESVRHLVPKYVFETQKNFFQCPACTKIFWKATHWDRAKEFAHEVCS